MGGVKKTGAGREEEQPQKTLKKPGKREKTLTKQAETYINVRVHGNGSAGGSVRRFRSMILGGNRDE